MTINLIYTVVEIEASEVEAYFTKNGPIFAVAHDIPFDALDYAEWVGVNYADIDTADIHAIQDAESQLGRDSWLIVDHG